MSLALLAKVAGMSTAVSATLSSFVYYSFKDTKLKDHLQDIKSKDERIEELEQENEDLSQQLGIAKNPIHFRFVCNPGDLSTEKQLDWNENSFQIDCKHPDKVTVNKKVV